MMKKEFKVGQVWKTRGGFKAVIVAVTFTGLVVAVTSQKETWGIFNFYDCGSYKIDATDSYDLIEPWVEPIETTLKLTVRKKEGVLSWGFNPSDNNIYDIETIKIKYTEGKGAEIVK